MPGSKVARLVLRRPRAAARAPFDLAKVRWPLLAAVPAAVALARKRRDLKLPRALSNVVAASVPLTVRLSLPRGRARSALLWGAQMWAYKVAYEIPYDRPERVRQRLRVDPPLRFDTMVGAGVPPTQRLQQRLREPARVNVLDRLLTAVYTVWEAEPHVALAVLLAKRPDRFAALALRQGATFDLTLLGYWLVPTAPPWWASEKQGRMDGVVQRVPTRVGRDLRNEPLEQDDVEGANPWASMPSDHFASALTAASVLREINPALGAVGLGYALALGFSLVYLGEHYVADLVAGAALAAGVIAAEPLVRPVAERADAVLRRLEP
ncbi:MAG TPA: phosphatase PAP2 family protein [Thermoleophilaceae bacterium]|nr:phosphatase PAP2 family protein [Thermoleophilaceae bacterium]